MNGLGFDLFVKRPVFTAVLSLLIVLFGVVCFELLSVRETPQVQPPTVTVTTTYFGADPSIMESDVTEPLERQLNGIEGVRTISSTSSEQTSVITVEFVLGRDLDEAANDVRSRVSRARKTLPNDIEEPIVEKADADASPVVFLRLDAAGKDLKELSEIADTLVRERLQTVPGASGVDIYGEQKYAMRLELNPDALASRGLTVLDVEQALQKGNVDAPAGRIEGTATEMTIHLSGDLQTPEQFEDLILTNKDGASVRLGDVGHARLGAENERTAARADGKATVTVAVLPQSNANIIDMSDEIRKRLPRIQEDLPDGVKLVLTYDRTDAVRTSIREVEETLAIAFLLVVAVIFVFLRDVRSTLVPTVAIPVSIVGTFAFLYFAGFSVNIFTLFGLVLAIGLVVDDAIVVLENVHRRIGEGEEPYTAAIEGTKQIAFAVIATTIVLVAVFVPIIFTGGTSGRLFLEFGGTVAVSVLLSAFVALTLTPMLCSRLLKPAAHAEEKEGFSQRTFGRMLRGLMRFPPLAALPVLAAVALGAVGYHFVPQEFFPVEDRNIFILRTQAPEGTSFEYMDARMKELEPELMKTIPERTSILSRVASGAGGVAAPANTGMFVVPLVPKEERERSQNEIVQAVRKDLGGVTSFMVIPIQLPTVGRGFGPPLQFVLQNPDFDALVAELPKFVAAMRQVPGLSSVNPDLRVNRPELDVVVDRDKAAAAGVAVRDVANVLQTMTSGRQLSTFKRNSRQYEVIAQVARDDRLTPDDIGRIAVRAKDGRMVPLANLVRWTERSSAASRFHYDRSPSATISANLDGITLGEGLKRVRAMAEKELPPGFRTALAGDSKEFAESSSSLLAVFGLAILIVYLVLAAQFDSFVDPLAILLAVPLALAGGLGSLWLTGMSLSFFSQVGLILLVGLVTKNGILIVEYARQVLEHEPDTDVWHAAAEAARLRFRPILMTSVATIGGALPIALGFSSESRAPLGVVVVGGMAVATTLTLFVTPVAWATTASLFRRRKAAVTAAAQVAAVVFALFALSSTARADELGLQDALRTALDHSRTIATAKTDVVGAEAGTQAAWSNVLPSVVGTGQIGLVGVDPRLGAGKHVVASAKLTVPLLDVSSIAGIASARADLRAAQAGETSTEEGVLADVAGRYIALQRAEMAVRAAQADVDRSQRLSERATDRAHVGVSPPIDATRAAVQLKQDQQRLIVAGNEATRARLALANALGLEVATPIDVTDAAPLVPVEQIPTDEALAQALKDALGSHPDVVAAVASLDAAHQDVLSTELGIVPTVDAYAQTGLYGDLAAASPYAGGGLEATVPLVLGGARIAGTKAARASEEASRIAVDDAKANVEVDLRTSLATLRDAAAALGVSEDALALAQQEVAQAEDEVETGKTDNSDLVQAQARLAEVEAAHTDAVAAYNLAVVGWFRAQGRLRELAR